MVYEHRCVMVELTDVRVAPEGDRSKLSAWRPSVVAVQRGTGVSGTAWQPLALEDGSGRSLVLAVSSVMRRLGRAMTGAT
jgi:hypothetical protein